MASIDELWLVDFGDPHPGEPAHQRPAVVIGPPNTFGPEFPYAVLVPLTTRRRGLSLHVEVEPTQGSGLADVSYAQCEMLRSVSTRRLVHRLGRIDSATAAAVDHVVRRMLGH